MSRLGLKSQDKGSMLRILKLVYKHDKCEMPQCQRK